jgi:hypothetical protein
VIDIYSTLLGAFLGSLLGFVASWLLAIRSERQHRKSVRTLLRVENEDNWNALHQLWRRAWHGRFGSTHDEDEEKVLRADFLVQVQQPKFSRIMWDTHVALLPMTLTSDEVELLYQVYKCLTRVVEIHTELTQLRLPEYVMPFGEEGISTPFALTDHWRVVKLMDELRAVAEWTLAQRESYDLFGARLAWDSQVCPVIEAPLQAPERTQQD